MKKYSKFLAVTLAAVMMIGAMSTCVSAYDVRQWYDSETDTSLTNIDDKIVWESGTYSVSSSTLTPSAEASHIRTKMNFGATQLYIECKPGYKLMFAELNKDSLTAKRKYGPSFKLPVLEWLDFTYLNTYRDKDYAIIIKSTNGSAVSVANAKNYVTISEVDTRYHVPEYTIDHLKEKAQKINNLQDKPGSYSFIFITDIHLQHNTKHSPAMIRYIRNQCSIDTVVGAGDFVTAWLGDVDGIRGLYDDMEELHYLFEDVPIFNNLGNHEWGYGSKNQWNLTNDEAYNRFYRDYNSYNKNVVYNDTKQYFYADDKVNKMRYISVNVMDYESHKVVTDYSSDNYTQNKTMWFEINQKQIDWLKEEALRLPGDDWNCMIVCHVPIYSGAAESPWGSGGSAFSNELGLSGASATGALREAIGNYINKTGDMADAKGNFVGIFNGHNHQNGFVKLNGFNNIILDGDTTISDEKNRVINTVTEQEFNVVTIDPENRMVYITKIGGGQDMEMVFKY